MYKCVCGKEFEKANSFNAHKGHCELHQLNKYGNLDYMKSTYALRGQQISNSLTKRGQQIRALKRRTQQHELSVWLSEKHKCEYCNRIMTVYYGSGRFCSKNCANQYSTTSNRKNTNMKIKESIHNIYVIEYNKHPKKCVICNKEISYEYRRRKTCSNKCLAVLRGQILKPIAFAGGLASANAQHRRSKNEIEFCKKCEQYFGKENVLHNMPMFNGWDADIILPQYKLAVLWNGPWHYKQVTKTHKLKQVQNRDKIKIKEIQKAGYREYIIKDAGAYDLNKVNFEFNNLLDYLT